MPAIFLVPIVAFFLSFARASNSYVPVTYVDSMGIVSTKKVLQPLIVVTDEDGVTEVRSGFKLEGSYSAPLPRMTESPLNFGDGSMLQQ